MLEKTVVFVWWSKIHRGSCEWRLMIFKIQCKKRRHAWGFLWSRRSMHINDYWCLQPRHESMISGEVGRVRKVGLGKRETPGERQLWGPNKIVLTQVWAHAECNVLPRSTRTTPMSRVHRCIPHWGRTPKPQLQNCDNYPATYVQRLIIECGPFFNEWQTGFRQKRECRDNILLLRILYVK